MEDTSKEDEYIQRGYDLCFADKASSEVQNGRALLTKAAELGRKDAHYYLGRSFEKAAEFKEAAKHYEDGLRKGHKAAVFRLALLHGGKRIAPADREFYLNSIRRLAMERYPPAIAKYSKERIRGSYGFAQIFFGMIAFLPSFIAVTKAAHANPEDRTLET